MIFSLRIQLKGTGMDEYEGWNVTYYGTTDLAAFGDGSGGGMGNWYEDGDGHGDGDEGRSGNGYDYESARGDGTSHSVKDFK